MEEVPLDYASVNDPITSGSPVDRALKHEIFRVSKYEKTFSQTGLSKTQTF